jgi:hypothetical protein
MIAREGAELRFNGEPNAYDRWRQPAEPDRVCEIDKSFWANYKVMASGQSFDILRCAPQ